jgi:sec-independent protein translocase protein TatB
MFGIGFWEMLVIAGLVLVAVGPDRLPGMLKQLAKFYRQFRRTADDIRNSTGIDQLLRDEELKELADLRKQKLDLLGTSSKSPVKAVPAVKPGAVVKPAPQPEKSGEIPKTVSSETADAVPMGGVPASKVTLHGPAPAKPAAVVRGVSAEDREREHPLIGVDLAEARHHEPPHTRPSMDVPPEHVHPSKAALFKAGA